VAREFELPVIHTSSLSFASDVKVAEAMRGTNPDLKIGFVSAKVAVEPKERRRRLISSRATSSISPSATWQRAGASRPSTG
jgi:hypothetical protein